MSLRPEFYPDTIDAYLEDEGGGIMSPWAIFVFPGSSPVFFGHFPDNPVLPAVIQMALVRFLTERCLGFSLRPKFQQRSRFTAIVTPNEPLRVDLAVSDEGGNFRTVFSLTRRADVVARGEIVYEREAVSGGGE